MSVIFSFQPELLKLFTENKDITDVSVHGSNVLRFASGMSEEIGRFLLHNGDLGGHEGKLPIAVWDNAFVAVIRENEKIAADLFHHVPPVTNIRIRKINIVVLNTREWHLQQCDMQSLSQAVMHKKLPQLKTLDLRHNTLTSFLKDLFGGTNHPGFPSLELLDLEKTHLNQEDVESLAEAVRAGKLPHLNELDLRQNTLTGFLKDLFGGTNHSGFPSLEMLYLDCTGLNREDVESLAKAVRAEKLPQLKVLNQSDNTLTGYLKDLFGGTNHPGFPSLEILYLEKTHLNQEDVKSLAEAVRAGKLPQLKVLNQSDNTLTGYLKDLFGGTNHPGFPSLEILYLEKTHLNQEDVKSLAEALRAGKLPQLKGLDLWKNTLTSFLKDLFGGTNHPGFPSLEKLALADTYLNQEDVESLSEAVRVGKLPQLKKLILRNNTLTGCLKDMLGGPDHPGFPHLENLKLARAHLNQVDVESMSEAIRDGKLPQLKKLILRNNTLTGCLKDMFGGPDHPEFPSLELLHLLNTDLNQEDVESLGAAVGAGKLPQLKELDVSCITLTGLEHYIGKLIAALDVQHEKVLSEKGVRSGEGEDGGTEVKDLSPVGGADQGDRLRLRVQSTGLSDEFWQKCRDKYPHVRINHTWF